MIEQHTEEKATRRDQLAAKSSAQTTNESSKSMNPILSILTPSIPSRIQRLGMDCQWLMSQLSEQIGGLPVEHLVLCDNRARSIGAKRQALVDIARGEYIAFVDDDDDVSDDYVARLLGATKTGADVITFRQQAIYNGLESEVHFGINNQDGPFNPGGITLRAPWHVCAWKRERVQGCLFSESNYGEDLAWCLQARRRARTAHHIDAVLHTYRHDASTTAAPEL
jgi:glycosyltransferase involved in cell wall biosynthesis